MGRELADLLEAALGEDESDELHLLCSGGVDSLSLGIAATRIGKRVTSYSFRLDLADSYDNQKAWEAAEAFDWDHIECKVDTSRLVEDIDRLIELGCVKKTQFETTYPFLYVYPLVTAKTVYSGLAADGLYGLSKRAMINFRYPKSAFDAHRREYLAPERAGAMIGLAKHVAWDYGITHVAPYYESDGIRDWMLARSWGELNKPKQKNDLRTAYADEFAKIAPVKNHLNLQKLGVSDLFADLLDEPVNVTGRVSVVGMLNDRRRMKAGTPL